jgi:hypothetical protein
LSHIPAFRVYSFCCTFYGFLSLYWYIPILWYHTEWFYCPTNLYLTYHLSFLPSPQIHGNHWSLNSFLSFAFSTMPYSWCYGLNMNCPSQAHALNSWSPAGSPILEVLETWGGTV